jgi:peptidoglycan/xylan/chitin deacetylase (PgdA/CDA1 family)
LIHIERVWACQQYQCPKGLTYPIHISFDDGPDSTNTPKILKILNKHKIKSTFFVIAEELEKFPEKEKIMDLIKSEGHQIGSHSYQHIHHTTLNNKQLEQEISKSKKILSKWLTKPLLFRLPYGDGWPGNFNKNKRRAKEVMEQIRKAGFTHIGWSVLPLDWDKKARRKPGILKLMTEQICKNQGGIIVLHDIQDHTAANLEKWIEALKCVGHNFASLKEFNSEGHFESHSNNVNSDAR